MRPIKTIQRGKMRCPKISRFRRIATALKIRAFKMRFDSKKRRTTSVNKWRILSIIDEGRRKNCFARVEEKNRSISDFRSDVNIVPTIDGKNNCFVAFFGAKIFAVSMIVLSLKVKDWTSIWRQYIMFINYSKYVFARCYNCFKIPM